MFSILRSPTEVLVKPVITQEIAALSRLVAGQKKAPKKKAKSRSFSSGGGGFNCSKKSTNVFAKRNPSMIHRPPPPQSSSSSSYNRTSYVGVIIFNLKMLFNITPMKMPNLKSSKG